MNPHRVFDNDRQILHKIFFNKPLHIFVVWFVSDADREQRNNDIEVLMVSHQGALLLTELYLVVVEPQPLRKGWVKHAREKRRFLCFLNELEKTFQQTYWDNRWILLFEFIDNFHFQVVNYLVLHVSAWLHQVL